MTITAVTTSPAKRDKWRALLESANLAPTFTAEEALQAFDRSVDVDPRIDAHIRRLVEDAFTMGLTVEWGDLGSSVRGLYVHSRSTIYLNSRMTGFQVVNTLAHELVHAAYGDTASTLEAEARANVLAAGLSLDPVRIWRSVQGTGSAGMTKKSVALLKAAYGLVEAYEL